MRAVVQRCNFGELTSEGHPDVHIGPGLVVLLGVKKGDTEEDGDYIAGKIMNLRIFDDEKGVMNRSVLDTKGDILLVSQFTLYGDARHGRRPSYFEAEEPEKANRLYEYVIGLCREKGIHVETGYFQAYMKVKFENDGPVTILLDSSRQF
jgi:D-tyrosyl-tRNA(Tyr) deacylase